MLLVKFVDQIPEIDKIVLGVDNTNQLKKIINANKSQKLNMDFFFFFEKEKKILDPRLW